MCPRSRRSKYRQYRFAEHSGPWRRTGWMNARLPGDPKEYPEAATRATFWERAPTGDPRAQSGAAAPGGLVADVDALAVALRGPLVVLLRKPQRRRSTTEAAAPFNKGTRMGRQRTREHLLGRRRTVRRNGRRRRREKVGIGVGASVSRRRRSLHLGGELRSEVESLRGRWPLSR